MQQQIEIDLVEVRRLITDTYFSAFLLEYTESFEISAFILQTLLDATRLPEGQTEPQDPVVDNE